MRSSWLIQRLNKPRGHINPFSFGGGLRNGGLSDEAMDLLNGIFSFDYMGAAEFEFGAVPKTLREMAKNSKKYEAFTIQIPLNKVEKDWRDKSESEISGEAVIYVICNKNDIEEVASRIEGYAFHRYNSNLKETTRLATVLRPHGEFINDTQGWLELDNGYFFFINREMWEKVAELFEIKVPK